MIFADGEFVGVSDRFNRQGITSWPATAVAMPLRRQIAAWLAILGLYVQLAAAGLCTCGLPVLSPAGPFPICHGQNAADNASQAPDHHTPVHHDECPFCQAHCHAAMVAAPGLASIERFDAVLPGTEPAPFIVPQAARFQAGAPPRGPPASI